jgi:hypothetical protein
MKQEDLRLCFVGDSSVCRSGEKRGGAVSVRLCSVSGKYDLDERGAGWKMEPTSAPQDMPAWLRLLRHGHAGGFIKSERRSGFRGGKA